MNEEKTRLRDSLQSDLAHFSGSEEYHRLHYPWLRKDFLLTDGAKYLADSAGAYWLIDIIASQQANKVVAAEEFQTWRLYVKVQADCEPFEADRLQDMLQDLQKLPSLMQADLFNFPSLTQEAKGFDEPDKPSQSVPTRVRRWQERAANSSALVLCEDGNGNILISQEIPYSDFPLDEIKLYATNDNFNGIVVMLPSEY